MKIPHGTACGLLMPPVMTETLRKLEETDRNSPALGKAALLGGLLTPGRESGDSASLKVLTAQLEEWAALAELPGLKELGADEEILVRTAAAGGNKNNPYAFSEEELLSILHSVF